MNQLHPLNICLWRGRKEKHAQCKKCRRKSKNWGWSEEATASEPGLCNGNHMVGGCSSDAPRLLREAAKQPDTFQETGGKHFLGLNLRQQSLHQEEWNEGARNEGKDKGGGLPRRPGKVKTDTAGYCWSCPSNYAFRGQSKSRI